MQKKHIKKAAVILLCLLLGILPVLGGCEKKKDPSAFQVFYVSKEQDGLVAKEYELQGTDLESDIKELIQTMSSETDSVDYLNPIPKNVSLLDCSVTDETAYVDFSQEYEKMDSVSEVLCRSAVTKTLLQLDGITGVSFRVEGKDLKDHNGNAIGVMVSDSFVDNPGEEIQNIQETEINLYFASTDGKSLVKEVQKVYYSSNMSVEKLVLERLLKAPKSENAQCAIPKGTQLINVSVMDGICLVNLDQGFLNYDFNISEDVVIYSIVDSLTDLPNIDTVQISVNGTTDKIYREQYSLSEQYKQNLKLVTEENENVKVVDEASPKNNTGN